jgi:hypothetical protein
MERCGKRVRADTGTPRGQAYHFRRRNGHAAGNCTEPWSYAAQKQGPELLISASGRSHSLTLQEALPAVNRAPLRRLKRNGCVFAALGANGFGLGSDAGNSGLNTAGTSHLAGFAPLRLVLEALVGIKHLFAGCEDEFGSTIGAFQNLIVIFHALLRNLAGVRTGSDSLVASRHSLKKALGEPASG